MKISSADTVQQSDSAVNLTVNSGVKVGWNAPERSSGAHQFGHKHSRAQAHNTLKVLMACSSGGPDIRRESRFFIQHLHWMPPLILIVYSGLERGIQSATEKLPLKRGARVLHSCNCPPPTFNGYAYCWCTCSFSFLTGHVSLPISCWNFTNRKPKWSCILNIYIFIHQNMIERTEQKVQQKSTHKKEKKQQ